MGVEQSCLILDITRPRPPKEDIIISGIDQHNSSWRSKEYCQDSGVWTALFQLGNAMPHRYFWDHSGDMESAQQESRLALYVCRGYPSEYYESSDTTARNADCLKICQVWFVGSTNDRHNRCSGRKLLLHIPPPAAGVHFTVYWATFQVCKAHSLQIELRLQWENCQKELNTLENIAVVQCSEDRRIIFNPTFISKTKIDFREELL